MLKRAYEGEVCSIARAFEIVGDRWTLPIVRDVALGRHRFDELLRSLGVASNVLTDRLNRLVDEGIFERDRYSARPERFEYHLTKKGRELRVALLALMQWGDRYVSEKPRGSRAGPATGRLCRYESWRRTEASSRPRTSSSCPVPARPAKKRRWTGRSAGSRPRDDP
jgi:DNA-binding HxlR family transcriptional regulator